jgi:hypothetical protein
MMATSDALVHGFGAIVVRCGGFVKLVFLLSLRLVVSLTPINENSLDELIHIKGSSEVLITIS